MSMHQPIRPRGFDLLRDVEVCLSVELGRTEMSLSQVMELGEDSVVPLDRLTDELLDVHVNGRPIARAEIVTQENRFALRIVEMAGGHAMDAAPIEAPADIAAEPA